jgi:hypothetical protein
MGNQNSTTVFTTTFVYFSKITGLPKNYQNCSLNCYACDQQGKVFGPTPNHPIPQLLAEGYTPPQGEVIFKILKDSNASFIKINLVSKGTFSDTEIGSAFFSISNFQLDQFIPFDLNLMSKQGQVVGKISLKIYIPGPIYEKQCLYKHAIKYQRNLTQIHFTKRMTMNITFNFDTTQFYNDILSMIFKVIEFTNSKTDIFELFDISSLYSSDTPMITITVRFRDEFISEAIEYAEKNQNFDPNSLETLIIPCTINVNGFPSELDPKGLQAKFFYAKNNNTFLSNIGYSLDFHSQNELNALKFEIFLNVKFLVLST